VTPPDPAPDAPVRRSRHLLDPADLAQSHRRSQGTKESLGNVQRWVMSVLAVTTILHLSAGLVLAAVYMDDARLDARIGLNVIAGVIGVLAVVIARAIHRKPPLSPWLLLGVIPGVIGLWITLS
jgi:hypothetical protein